MVGQLASAGQPAFDKFLGSFGTAVAGVSTDTLNTTFAPFTADIKGLLEQVGQFGGADLMASVAKGLANNPQGAQQLRDILAGLMAPKEVSPGVFAVPKAGGGYYPLRMSVNADGGVYGRDAMIRNSPVLWAEAGPEAYIPMNMAKAKRSVSLLGQVADFYGYGLIRMANGGIVGGSSSPGTMGAPVFNLNLNVSVAAGVDPNAVGVAVRREVERSFDQLAAAVRVKAWRN
jgi:hypothetical protein